MIKFTISVIVSIILGFCVYVQFTATPFINSGLVKHSFELQLRDTFNDERTNGFQSYSPGSIVYERKSVPIIPVRYAKLLDRGVFEATNLVNSDGFLDHEFDFKNTNCNILFIGDSYVASHQVDIEQKFFRILENKLENLFKANISVHGAGVDGTSVVHQIEFLKYLTTEKQYSIDLVVFPIILNDVRDSYGLLDIAAFNRAVFPKELTFPIVPRTSVYGGMDGKPFKIIHPTKSDYGMSVKFLEGNFKNWTHSYNSGVRELVNAGLISGDDIGSRFGVGKYEEIGPEEYLGFSNLEPFWDAVVRSYDYSVEKLLKDTGLSKENFAAFTTHSMYKYNNKAVKEHFENRISIHISPWKKRGIEVYELDAILSEDEIFNLDIIHDGHLSIEGHKKMADVLTQFLKEKVKNVCKM